VNRVVGDECLKRVTARSKSRIVSLIHSKRFINGLVSLVERELEPFGERRSGFSAVVVFEVPVGQSAQSGSET